MKISPRELENYLPGREIFPETMPRYPNLWFFVDDRLALRNRYNYAILLVVRLLEQHLGMKDDFLTGVDNHIVYHLLSPQREGSDFQMRLGPFHPYGDSGVDFHHHQVHARFYVDPFHENDTYAITIPSGPAIPSGPGGPNDHDTTGERRYLVCAASVHYEVSTEDPLHPYVDSCPLCGITGAYDLQIDPESEDYCVKIHDPIGLELMLNGTVRGNRIYEDRARPYTSLGDLAGRLEDVDVQIMEIEPEQYEPRRMGFVFAVPKQPKEPTG